MAGKKHSSILSPRLTRPLESDMMQRPLLLAMLLCGVLGAAQAATPKEQYAADSKAANDRFASDKKICADEATAAARMQCARDAKTEHDKAMASAKEKLTAA